MPTLRFVILAVSLVGPAPGYAEPARPQVIGGSPVPNGMFPFLVGLLREETAETGEPSCTGSLIRPRWILTAAHCGEPSEVLISDRKPGTLGPGHEMYSIPVVQWIPHPGFDDTVHPFQNDVALIEIGLDAEEFPPELDGIPLYVPAPIGLALGPATTAAPIGDVIIAGFGYTDPAEEPPSPATAHWASRVPTVGISDCDIRGVSADQNLCYGPYPNTCSGDSGGPIFQNRGADFLQVAITSVGAPDVPCATLRDAGSWIPHYVDWINETISPPGTSPITLGWELPPPQGQGIASGISNGQGWVFSTAGTITSVQLFIDGNLEATLPCCSERGDAPGPLLSGFAGAINWGRFSPGRHRAVLVVRDSAGNEKTETRTIETVQILRGQQFVSGLSFDTATCTAGGSELTCSNVQFQQGACPGEIHFDWFNGKQALEVSQGCSE